jgi:large subunit ribosomal protein L25
VPAVVYGHGIENQHVTLPGHELMLALKTPNVLIRLDGAGTSGLTLPKAVQRHAIKGFIEHVDLITVRQGEKVTVEIPVRVSGDVIPGGVLDQQLTTISVQAEATHIPDGVDVDVEGMEIGTTVAAQDLVLPEGTELDTDAEALVLHVVAAQTQAQFEADLGEGEGTEDEATEGAEAPAEGE